MGQIRQVTHLGGLGLALSHRQLTPLNRQLYSSRIFASLSEDLAYSLTYTYLLLRALLLAYSLCVFVCVSVCVCVCSPSFHKQHQMY